MNWTICQETSETCEYHESEAGIVEHRGLKGWDAFVYIPSNLRKGHATKHKVGECYPSATSAKAAVKRAYRKYAPCADNMEFREQEALWNRALGYKPEK